jgi:RHS repeat-associated protein
MLSAKENGTGTLYRRNRYLDPATGRVTLEDPIGLAGGVNLYGFADGDPVNYSDPFGLCAKPHWLACLARLGPALSRAGQAISGAAQWYGARFTNFYGNVLPGGISRLTGSSVTQSGIRFAQQGISQTFRHGEFAGKTISEVSAGLRSGAISPDRLPINVVVREGVSYAMNNRSLMALRQAGMEPAIVNNVTGNAFFEQQLTTRLGELGGKVAADFVPFIRGPR